MTQKHERATPCPGRPSQTVRLGEFKQHHQDTPNGGVPASQWEEARSLQRQASDCARAALLLRGGDRLQQVAIAAALFGAARSVALNAGGAR